MLLEIGYNQLNLNMKPVRLSIDSMLLEYEFFDSQVRDISTNYVLYWSVKPL